MAGIYSAITGKKVYSTNHALKNSTNAAGKSR